MGSTDQIRRKFSDELGSCTRETLHERLAEFEQQIAVVDRRRPDSDVGLLSALGTERW